MRGRKIFALILPFVVAFFMGASFAVSQAAGFDGWFGIGAKPEPEAKASPEPLEALETHLTLRPDQKDDFRGFRRYCDRDLCQCRRRIAKARAALGTAILSEPSDPMEIEEARRELLAVYDECSREMVDRLMELGDDLDTAQKKKLADAFFPGAAPRCGGCGGGGCGGGCGQGYK